MLPERFEYERVATLIERQIAAGALRPRERVPSLRAMSRHAGVSIGTVVQAYMSLEQRGLLETRPRSGYFVAAPASPVLSAPAAQRVARPRPRAVARRVMDILLESLSRRDLIALNSAIAASATRLDGRLNSITRSVLRDEPGLPNALLTPPGLPELRREIAKRCVLHGLVVTADDIVITNGTMEAIMLSLAVVCRPGDTVLVESPTYFGILQVIEHLRLKVVEVPNRPGDGIDPAAVATVLAATPVRAAVFQSGFNNPTGALTPDAAKAEIVHLLGRHRVTLIEDDIYGDLHFGDPRPRPFAAFDAAGSVITCASISKTVALGFRIGWAVSPRHAAALSRAKFCSSVATAALQQHVIARYLTRATHDRHLRQVRAALRDNCRRFTATLAEAFPAGTRVSDPEGGVVLWVELPGRADGVALFEKALTHRVGIAPGVIFSARGDYRQFIRLSAGVRWSEGVERALWLLGELVEGAANGR